MSRAVICCASPATSRHSGRLPPLIPWPKVRASGPDDRRPYAHVVWPLTHVCEILRLPFRTRNASQERTKFWTNVRKVRYSAICRPWRANVGKHLRSEKRTRLSVRIIEQVPKKHVNDKLLTTSCWRNVQNVFYAVSRTPRTKHGYGVWTIRSSLEGVTSTNIVL